MDVFFYCTKIEEMACEWACKKNTDGFINSYILDDDNLKVLNWIVLLLQYGTFKLDTQLSIDARDYIIKHYSIDLAKYDVEDLLENLMA